MRRYTVDLHVHTRASPDAVDQPEVVVEAARRVGLDAIAITDHDRRGGYDRLVRLGLADPAGLPVDGFLVIPGVEVSCVEGHVLVIGATFDAEVGLPASEVVRRAEGLGAFAIAAHPFDRLRSGVGRRTLETAGFHGVEVWNSKTFEPGSNAAAGRFASDHGLIKVAGSDAHFADAVGRAHTLVEAEDLTTGAIVAGLRDRRTEVVKGLHSPVELARYWVRGWLTRPWVLDMAGRGAMRVGRRLAAAVW